MLAVFKDIRISAIVGIGDSDREQQVHDRGSMERHEVSTMSRENPTKSCNDSSTTSEADLRFGGMNETSLSKNVPPEEPELGRALRLPKARLPLASGT